MVVIGVGNVFRSDDGFGPKVAQLVRTIVPEEVEVVECDGEAAGLLLAWEGADLALVVDAVHSHSGAPGQIFRLELNPSETEVPSSVVSSHGTGPGDAVALALALGRLPGRLVLYGIEGVSFSSGESLTPAVEASVAVVAARVVEESEWPTAR